MLGRKQRPPRLASVTKLPGQCRPGPPYKTLSSAVARSASERDVLMLLRKRLAAQIDDGVIDRQLPLGRGIDVDDKRYRADD